MSENSELNEHLLPQFKRRFILKEVSSVYLKNSEHDLEKYPGFGTSIVPRHSFLFLLHCAYCMRILGLCELLSVAFMQTSSCLLPACFLYQFDKGTFGTEVECRQKSKTKTHYVVDAFHHPHPPLDVPPLVLIEEAFEFPLSWNLSSSRWPLLSLIECQRKAGSRWLPFKAVENPPKRRSSLVQTFCC